MKRFDCDVNTALELPTARLPLLLLLMFDVRAALGRAEFDTVAVVTVGAKNC